MIDLTFFENIESQKLGLLNDKFTESVSTGDFKLEKYTDLGTRNGVILYGKNNFNYVPCMVDDLKTIKLFYSELFDKEFNSILIGGLGLGIIPYILKSICNTIDVVEKNIDLIDLITSRNYLGEVNIINEDIFEHIPNKKYDFILIDIWTDENKVELSSEINVLISKYQSFINRNGVIYIPINKNNGQTIWRF